MRGIALLGVKQLCALRCLCQQEASAVLSVQVFEQSLPKLVVAQQERPLHTSAAESKRLPSSNPNSLTFISVPSCFSLLQSSSHMIPLAAGRHIHVSSQLQQGLEGTTYPKFFEHKTTTPQAILDAIGPNGQNIPLFAKAENRSNLAATQTLLYLLAKKDKHTGAESRRLFVAAYQILEATLIAAFKEPSARAERGAGTVGDLQPKDLSLIAWSAARLQRLRHLDTHPLCLALIAYLLQHESILSQFSWRDWGQTLYSFAKAGLKCEGPTSPLQQLFDRALPFLTPNLELPNLRRDNQSICNILSAGARAKAKGDWDGFVGGLVEGHKAGICLQSLNMYDCSDLARDAPQLSLRSAELLSILEQGQIGP